MSILRSLPAFNARPPRSSAGSYAFSRYEKGKTRPPLALVKLLRVLDHHPDMLSEVPSTPTPPKLSQRSSSAYKNSGLKRVMAVKPERNRLLDETGWRQNGEKRWIWAFVAPVFTFYIVATSRGVAVLESLPGAAFEGILCSDRLPSYLSYHQGRAQLCWARLKLNLMEIELGDDWSATFRSRRVASIRQVVPPLVEFSGWPADRTQLLRRSLPIQREFLKLAE